MPFEKGKQKTGGKTAGTPNKATQAAREAIGQFVDNNAHRLQEWLDAIATGRKKEGAEDYIIVPNPEKAFNLFQSVIEYHVPKLARTENATTLSGELTVTTLNIKPISPRGA